MRNILTVLFLLIGFSSYSQVYDKTLNRYGYEIPRIRVLLDIDIPSDTTNNKSGVARIGNTLYAGNGTNWFAAAGGSFIDSAIWQTKYRSDTARINTYITIDTIQKVWINDDGLVLLTRSNDTVHINLGGTASPLQGNYIILYPTLELVDNVLNVNPNVVYYQDGVRDTIVVGAEYTIPYASPGTQRIDALIINNGALDTLAGVEDSSTVVPRSLTGSQLLVGYINVYGTDSVVVALASTYQQTAIPYINASRRIETDSTRFSFDKVSNRVNIGLGTEKFSLTALPGDYAGGSAALISAENLWLSRKTTSANGGGMVIDYNVSVWRPSGNVFRNTFTDGNKYMEFGHDIPGAKYGFKLSTTSPYGNNLTGLQFGYKNRVVIGDSLVAADSCTSCAVYIKSPTKGFRPPVHSGTQMNAVTSPAAGLIVYNSDSAALCLYNGSAWVKLSTGGGSGWGLNGNSGTTASANFIGTIDNNPLVFKTNNTEIARLGGDDRYSIKLGLLTVSTGYYSFACGGLTTSTGTASFSAGGSTSAAGNFSVAMGSGGIANGTHSFVGNVNNIASGNASTAFGNTTRSKSFSGTVVGSFNDTTDAADATSYHPLNRAFQVGIGNGIDLKGLNALTVLMNGKIGIGTNNPDSTVHIAGGLKLDLPSKGAGKVLMDVDGSGAATWQTPSGGSGGGINYVVQSSTPTDTTKLWLDTSGGYKRVWPLKRKITGGWQSEKWYDPVLTQWSNNPPVYVLGTHQSNGIPRCCGGDTTSHPLVAEFRSGTWTKAQTTYPVSNNITLQYAKNKARYDNVIVRFVLVGEASQPISKWQHDSTKTDEIAAIVRQANIDSFNIILFRQGEQNADLGNTEAEYSTAFSQVFAAYRDSSWFGKSGKVIAGGLNESYINTGVYNFYNHLNDPEYQMENVVGVSMLGLSRAGGIHINGASIDPVGLRYYMADKGYSRQYSLKATPNISSPNDATIAITPVSGQTLAPSFRTLLNTSHLLRGGGMKLDSATSNLVFFYNNTISSSNTQANDVNGLLINQSGNLGIGGPNIEVTTNVAKAVWYPQSGGPGLHTQWRNSTGTRRLSIDTGAFVISQMQFYNAGSAAGDIVLKHQNSTDVESGRIRMTKANTSGADNNLGVYWRFDGSGNWSYLGSNNTNGSTGTTGDIDVIAWNRAGTLVGIVNTSPTSALHTTSFATAYTSTATGITLGIAHHTVDVTATGQTITLPTAASITGRCYTIKLTASGTGTVATTSSQTIDGSTTYSLSAQYKYVTVQSNGSNWIIIANN